MTTSYRSELRLSLVRRSSNLLLPFLLHALFLGYLSDLFICLFPMVILMVVLQLCNLPKLVEEQHHKR